jgi:hypothetical protein
MLRGDQAATVVAHCDLVVNFAEYCFEVLGGLIQRTTGIRFQVVGARECFAVIVFNLIQHGAAFPVIWHVIDDGAV